jgi:hypothetical protein
MGCQSTSTIGPDGVPRVDWKRAADGIGLCGFAVFLLLTTTGVLPWSFWIDAISLWPLLIMSAGIKIAFERTRVPWLVLLAPAITIAGLAWVATGARPGLPPGPWTSQGPLPRPEGIERVKLDAEVMASRLTVESREIAAGEIADARTLEQGDPARISVDRQDGTAQLRIDTGQHGGFVVVPGGRRLYDLGLPRELPLVLQLHGVMSRSRLDLARGRLETGTIDGAFLATEITLPALDAPVKLRQKGAFNVLRLNVPDGTPVNVHGVGFPFNILKRRVRGAPGRAGYEVTLEGAFSAVSIETRPALPREAPPAERLPAESPTPETVPLPPSPASKHG